MPSTDDLLDDFDPGDDFTAPLETPQLDNPVQVIARALGNVPKDGGIVLEPDQVEHVRQLLALATAKDQSVSLSSAGLAIQLDLPTLLNAIDPGGRWLGYDPDEDEDRYSSASLADLLVQASAELLVKRAGRTIDSAVQDAVTTRAQELTEEYVRTALETGTLQETTDTGIPKGEPRPLLTLIRDAAIKVLTVPQGDGYGSRGRQTMLAKMVDEAVGKALKVELQAEVATVREAAKKAVRDNAADVIAETIERATRGL